MAFHDNAVFPTDINLGTASGPSFGTIIQETPSGRSVRIARADEPTMRFDVAKQDLDETTAGALLSFIRARRGSLHGFRLMDFADFSTAPDHVTEIDAGDVTHRQTIGVGDGGVGSFPLIKTYTDSGETVTRRVEKPMRLAEAQAITHYYLGALTTGQHFRLWIDGVIQTEGGDYTVDYSTGYVTTTGSVTVGHVVQWAGYFFVPVRFSAEADQFSRVFAPSSLSRSFEGLSMVEEKTDTAVVSLARDPGGATKHVATALTHQLELYDGSVQLFDADGVASLAVNLPDAADWLLGGPVVFMANVGSTISITVKDYGGTTLFTLTPGYAVRCYLAPDGSGGYDWVIA